MLLPPTLELIKWTVGRVCVLLGMMNIPELPIVLHVVAHLPIFRAHSVPQKWTLRIIWSKQKGKRNKVKATFKWCEPVEHLHHLACLEERSKPVSLLAGLAATFLTTTHEVFNQFNTIAIDSVLLRTGTSTGTSWGVAAAFFVGKVSRHLPFNKV